MTSKERVLMTIAHEEPDRIPTGEWEFGREMVEPVLGKSTYRNQWATKHALWQGRRDDVIRNWKNGLVNLAEYYQWDAVLVHNCIGQGTPIEAPEPAGENKWRNSSGDIIIYSPETDNFLITERGPNQPAPVPPSKPADPQAQEPTESELEVVRHVVRELGKTHFILCAPLQGHPGLSYSDASRSEVENWVQVWEDPEGAGEDRLKRATSPSSRRGIEIAKREGMDAIAWGCDYGYNTGPFISPEIFRIAVFPGLKAFCDLVHEHGMVTVHHSCGNNFPLVDQMIEAGVDAWQSIQPENDIVKLKKRYGKNITIWGGVPAGALVSETPARVKEIARQNLEVCKPGGGFIYATSHSIMPQAKFENYRVMLEVLREYGTYAVKH